MNTQKLSKLHKGDKMDVETIFNFLLFTLSLVLSYALLTKLKIFPRSTNAIVSLVISIYFLFAAVNYTENFMQILAYSILFLFVAFIAIAAYKGGKETHKKISEKSK